MSDRLQDTDPWHRPIQNWLRAHRPVGTVRSYTTYQKQYLKFCEIHSRAAVPATPATVVMFMRTLLLDGKSRSTIVNSARAAVADLHTYEGYASPTLDPLVQRAVRVFSRLTPPPKSAKALRMDHIRAMIDVYGSSFRDTRDIFMMLLMTTAMLRESEATNLKDTDVWIERKDNIDVLFVFIEKSKVDQTRVGHTVVMGTATDPLICPLAWFLRLGRFQPQGRHVFMSAQGKKLSAKTPNGILKRWMTRAGLSNIGFSSHSCRRGGASAAAAAQVCRRLLMRHGNWRSNAVDVYITDTLAARLSVSNAILHSEFI